MGEQRSIADESVEFAVLAAGVHVGREIRQESCIERTPAELVAQVAGIRTYDNGAESERQRFLRQLSPVAVPQRQDRREAGLRAHLLFPVSVRLQIDIAED